jgi:hypothetical protein
MLIYNIIMSANQEIEKQLQQWIQLDDQLKSYNEKVKEIRDRKNKLGENITNYASKHNLSNNTFQMNDSRIRFGQTKTQQQITLTYLQKCLGEIIKNEAQSKQIFEYIKNNRETKVIAEIRRL